MADSWFFADIEGQWEPEWELDHAFARSIISGTIDSPVHVFGDGF
jgi:hypothetical protein